MTTTMKKYTIWNCLSKKEENKEIKVFVLNIILKLI